MTAIALPAGPVLPWCIGAVNLTNCPDQNLTYPGATWTTICCDGSITDSARILADGKANTTIDVFDLICCGGDPRGIFDSTTCSPGITPTPLASLAATNTRNAQQWIGTDVHLAWNPYCVWLGSSTSVPETTVTVSTFSAKHVPPSNTISITSPPSISRTPASSGATIAAPSTITSRGVQWKASPRIWVVFTGLLALVN